MRKKVDLVLAIRELRVRKARYTFRRWRGSIRRGRSSWDSQCDKFRVQADKMWRQKWIIVCTPKSNFKGTVWEVRCRTWSNKVCWYRFLTLDHHSPFQGCSLEAFRGLFCFTIHPDLASITHSLEFNLVSSQGLTVLQAVFRDLSMRCAVRNNALHEDGNTTTSRSSAMQYDFVIGREMVNSFANPYLPVPKISVQLANSFFAPGCQHIRLSQLFLARPRFQPPAQLCGN